MYYEWSLLLLFFRIKMPNTTLLFFPSAERKTFLFEFISYRFNEIVVVVFGGGGGDGVTGVGGVCSNCFDDCLRDNG